MMLHSTPGVRARQEPRPTWGTLFPSGSRCALLLGICLIGACAKDNGAAAPGPAPAEDPGKAPATGLIEGTVRYDGEIPKSRVADDTGYHRDLIEVDPGTKGLQSVVVWLAIDSPPPSTINASASDLSAAPREPAVIDQIDHAFRPHLVAVRAGQAVQFTNSDPANHNVRAASANPRNEFNVYTGTGGSHTHRFQPDAQGRPVRLGCDIHPWMSAWVYVFEHPYFAVTDAQGRFRITGVPPGSYQLQIRQPDAGYRADRQIAIVDGKSVPVEIRIRRDEVQIR